jgi:hypothetical protein
MARPCEAHVAATPSPGTSWRPERGRTPVLIIDEAHLLDQAQLESIRMLTNHDMDSTSPFACLLVGQPTLRRRMKMGALAALDQRIGLRYAMPPMTPEETGSYLRHHLGLAGRSDTLFSDDAAALIHQTSRGYPRAVNNLALQALVAAFADDKTIVDESSARIAVTEVTAERAPRRHPEHHDPARHQPGGVDSSLNMLTANAADMLTFNAGQQRYHPVPTPGLHLRRRMGRRIALHSRLPAPA